MSGCDNCRVTDEQNRVLIDSLREQIKAYEAQFDEMDAHIEKIEERNRELELTAIKIQCERDAIIQYTKDIFQGVINENGKDKINSICKKKNTGETILPDRRGEIEASHPAGLP